MGDSRAIPSGVFRAPADVAALRAALERENLRWVEVNLEQVTGKREFLRACAKALRFPRTFGGNWDALADCLKDLCAECVVNMRHCTGFAQAAPDDYATALEVFAEAATYWQERTSVFLALADAEPEAARLPRLPGARR